MGQFYRRPGLTAGGLVYERPTGDAQIRDGWLFDFDIDDEALKPNHVTWLGDVVRWMADHLPERKQTANPGERPWKVSIDGYASHTGTKRHNDILSVLREQAVAAFFFERFMRNPALDSSVQVDTKFHGFLDSPETGEDAYYRAARVVAHRPS
ncbi:MAG: hypothetical protein JO212_04565, partial [Acetobacteraceae bacterium]|nr:hypothetical protein [Acetobacteraceae bacterium]